MASSSRSVLCSVSRTVLNSPTIRPPLQFRGGCLRIRSQHSSSHETSPSEDIHSTTTKNESFSVLQPPSIFQQSLPSSSIQEEIEYLDSLNPQNQLDKRKRDYVEDGFLKQRQQWGTTLDAVKKSFSLDQLKRMIHQTDAPKTLLQQIRRQRKAKTMSKDVYARALIIHRFGLEDPSKKSLDEENKVKAEKREIFQHTLPLHVAHLAFDIATKESGGLFRKLGVSVSASKSPNTSTEQRVDGPTITVDLTGTKQSVEEVKAWLSNFGEKVHIEKRLLSDLVSSDWLDLSDVTELDRIAQLSKSIILLGDAPNYEVTIYSANKSYSKKAKSLLTKFQHEVRSIKDRAMLMYASPSVSKNVQDSMPIYAMQPMTGMSASTSPFDSVFFRLARQDRDSYPITELFIPADQNKPNQDHGKYLGRIDQPDMKGKAVLDAMRERLGGIQQEQEPAQPESDIVFHADFGHLLFKEDPNSVQELIPEPPLAGQWILEQASSWLSKAFQQAGERESLPVHSPVFHHSIPPSIAKVPSTEVNQRKKSDLLFFGKNNLNLGNELNQNEETMQDESAGVSAILQSLNASFNETPKHPKLVDLMKKLESFEEFFLMRYVGEGEIVEIKLEPVYPEQEENHSTSFMDDLFGKDESVRKEQGEEPSWKVSSVERIRSTMADIFIPESPADVRLSANQKNPLQSWEQLFADEKWPRFISRIQPTNKTDKMFMFENVTKYFAPEKVELEGKKYSLMEQVSINQWKWELDNVRDTDQPFKTKAVYTIEQDSMFKTPSKPKFRLEWQRDENFVNTQNSPESQSEEGKTSLIDQNSNEEELESSNDRLTWAFMKRYINSVIETPYSNGNDL